MIASTHEPLRQRLIMNYHMGSISKEDRAYISKKLEGAGCRQEYIFEEKDLSINQFTFGECTFDFILEYRNWLLDKQHRAKSTANNRIAAIILYLCYAATKDITLQQFQLNVAEVPYPVQDRYPSF